MYNVRKSVEALNTYVFTDSPQTVIEHVADLAILLARTFNGKCKSAP